MTKELLEQYPDICAELADLERAARTPVSDVVSGSSGEYPYTQHAVTIRGLPIKQNRARIEALRNQKDEIEEFIAALPFKHREIVTLRVLHGLKWSEVSNRIRPKKSKDSLRVTYNRIFSQKP